MGFNQILPRIIRGRMESDKHEPMRWSPINTVEHVKPNKRKPNFQSTLSTRPFVVWARLDQDII